MGALVAVLIGLGALAYWAVAPHDVRPGEEIMVAPWIRIQSEPITQSYMMHGEGGGRLSADVLVNGDWQRATPSDLGLRWSLLSPKLVLLSWRSEIFVGSQNLTGIVLEEGSLKNRIALPKSSLIESSADQQKIIAVRCLKQDGSDELGFRCLRFDVLHIETTTGSVAQYSVTAGSDIDGCSWFPDRRLKGEAPVYSRMCKSDASYFALERRGLVELTKTELDALPFAP